MIQTSKQYQITVDQVVKFQHALAELLRKDGLDPLYEVQVASIESLLQDLTTELHVYRLLRRFHRE